MSAAEDDDTVDERTDFKLTATGGDYEGKEETVRIAVADNDRYLVVKPDSLTVAEGGSGNFTVALSSAPSAEVTVTLRRGGTSSSDVTFDTDPTTDGDQSALTFTTSNWNEARTVTVSAAEDADALADRATIELSAAGGDYAGKSESVSVSVSENDAAGLTVSPTDLTVSEGGSETFEVSLATQPSASVTVTLAQPSDTDVRVDTDSATSGNQVTLSFTTENWNEARTVQVSAAEDDDTVDESMDFKLTATGGDYEGKEETVRIAVADNDRYLVVKPDSLTVAEGGSGNFTVALSSAPSAEVTVTLRRGGTSSSDVTFDTDPTTDGDQSALTFTTSNWNEARTVTVSAAEDADALADRETIELNASGGDYAGKSESVSVSVSENDTAGLTVSPTDLTVSEGGSETFKVSLATQPSASVTVTLAQPSDTDVRVDTDSATSGDQTTLSFTTENWNEARTVQVSAAEDDDTVDESMDFKLTATGGDYEGKEETVRIAVADNDRYLVVKPDSLTVAEGGSGNFTVALSSAPSAEVTVTLRRGGTSSSDVTFDTDPTTDGDQSALTFTTSNWNEARTVTVSAAEDADALADRATIELSASGGDYAGKSESVSVSVSENDAAGLTVSPTDLTVSEGGSETFKVSLATQPSASVTVTLAQPSDTDVRVDTDPVASGNQVTLSFTTENWNEARTVSVSAAEDDDTVDERTDFKLTATGGDYEGKEETVRIAVADNDRYLVVKPDSLTVAEGGSGNFTVALSSAPSAEVTVTLRRGGTSSSDVTFDTDPTTDGDQSALTFTTSNWNEARTVTVSAAEDADALADRATIELSAAGGDYAGKSESVSVSVSENDAAGLTVSPTDLTVSEGGSETFEVSLATQPSASVTVTLAQPSDTDVRVDTDPVASGNQVTLSFTTENWNEARTVSVSAAEDDDTVDERTDFKLTATGGDYEGKEETVRIAVADNDRYLVVKPDSLTVAEGGSGNFTVALSSAPSAEVTVTLRRGGTSSSDVTFDTDPTTDGDQSALTFTTSNWNEARTVTVSAAEDADALADRATIELSASGGDYAGKSESVSVSVSENDAAGLSVSPTDLTVDEGGNNTFTVALTSAPSAEVTVTLRQATDNSDVTFDTDPTADGNQSTLSFTAGSDDDDGNWRTGQTVTVSAAQDADAADESASISLIASGGDYAGKSESVSVSVSDDETLALVVSESSLTVAEGSTKTFDVKLSHDPVSDVSVSLTKTNTDAVVTLSRTSLTFTGGAGGNWSRGQTVTVSGVDDADAANETDTVTVKATNVAGVADKTVAVAVTDNERLALVVTPDGDLAVGEGSTGTVTVKLSHDPGAGVSVSVSLSKENDDITLSRASLTFAGGTGDEGNWSTAQSVTVMVGQDDDAANDSGSVTVSATATGFTDIADKTVSVAVADDDRADLTLSKNSVVVTGVSVSEESTATFDVRLATQPSGSVTVTIARPSNADVTVDTDTTTQGDQTTLTFGVSGSGVGSWKTDQTVTVSASADDDAVDDRATLTLSASGGGYDGISKELAVSVSDNDTAALMLSVPSLSVDEGGSKTFTVRLATEPSATVTVTLRRGGTTDSDVTFDTDPTTDGNQSTLTFTTSNWNEARTVTVSAAEDADALADRATIELSAAGGDYAGKSESVSVSVSENDAAGLTVSPTDLTVSEGGSETFEVSLATQPSASVTVTLAQPSDTDVRVDTDSATSGNQVTLSFTTENWNEARTVSVSAAEDDDTVDERTDFKLTATGGDYEGKEETVRIAVADNDRYLVVKPDSLTVAEGGSGNFTVALSSAPSAEVTVTLRRGGTSSSDVTFDTDPTTDGDQSALTFTTSNWNEARTVTVSAAEDADALADRATIELSASGGDYAGKSESVSVSVSENDAAALTVSPTDLTVSEGGSETFKVSLATQPSASVTVTLAQPSDTDVRVDTDPVASGNQVTLSFTTENWNEARTVSVSAAEDDDTVDERTDFKLTATGGDYEGKEETVRIAVADNDRYLVVKPDSLTVAEGGSGNFTVALSSAPSAEVTVTLRRGGTSSSDVTSSTPTRPPTAIKAR